MGKSSFKITKWNGKQLKRAVDVEEKKRLQRAAIHLKNEVKKNISTKGVKCNKGEETGNRSKPGDFPHIECGELRRSMAHEIHDRTMVALVGTNKPYGKFLEIGTRYMEKRPFLRPTLAEQRRTIRRILLGKKIKKLA